MVKTLRLDVAMVQQALARSRTRAGEFIRSGRVSVDGVVTLKPSLAVTSDSRVDLENDDVASEYVSRAAIKLAGALNAFDQVTCRAQPVTDRPLVTDQVCVDIGASTGGFTDVLLRRGARHVLAIDVGHDQFDSNLAKNNRVTVREGLNVRDLTAQDIPDAVGLVVGDLSFISLRLVLPALGRAMPGTDLFLMVKPQFEVGKDRLGRGGVVRDPALHINAVEQVCATAAAQGLNTRAIVASSLPGPSGNREFFCWFSPNPSEQDAAAVKSAITAAVHDPTGGAVGFYVRGPVTSNTPSSAQEFPLVPQERTR